MFSSKEWVKSLLNKFKTSEDSLNMVTCSTSASTSAKVVTPTNFKLQTGAKITVKFTYINSAYNPTLNVKSSGAKGIRQYIAGTYITPITMPSICEFVYDGTYWILMTSLVDVIPPVGKEICIGTFGGKPLYRRLFSLTLPTVSSDGVMTKEEVLDSEIPSLTQVVNITTIMDSGSTYQQLPNLTNDGKYFGKAYYDYAQKTVDLVVNNSTWSGRPITVIFEYTKS